MPPASGGAFQVRRLNPAALAPARLGLVPVGVVLATRSTSLVSPPHTCPPASRRAGMPVGLQIVGRRFADLTVLPGLGRLREGAALSGQAAARGCAMAPDITVDLRARFDAGS